MVMQKKTEIDNLYHEIETKKAMIIHEDPLDVENEIECAVQAKE